MSYLLTEIALEMLGYKFYDPNGEYHLINFQQSVPHDVHPNEPSLEDFINHSSATEPHQNDISQLPTASVSNGNNNLRTAPVESNQKLPDIVQLKPQPKKQLKRLTGSATAAPKATGINSNPKMTNNGSNAAGAKAQKQPTNPPSTAPESGPKTSTIVRRTPAKALAKIMNYENYNIRSQMLERLEESIKKEVGIPEELALQKCFQIEIEKITEDANNMTEFRQILEQGLCLIDERRYETYLRTFNNEKS